MAKAFILAGLKFHIETETPMKEFMWRPGSTLRPPVVADSTILVKEMVVPASASVKVIDSFQTQSSTSLSSSGGTVVSTVTNISEAAAKDTDATYTWLATNPHNGSVRALSTDSQKRSRGIGIRISALEWTVPASMTDMSAMDFVELRVAQGTRHPNTVALNGGANFSIILRDALGIEARVSSSAQGEAVNQPYQRIGDGSGLGWQNDFRTIRLRLRDFQGGGTGLKLSMISSVRIEVGGSFGSSLGRFIMDDLQFTKE